MTQAWISTVNKLIFSRSRSKKCFLKIFEVWVCVSLVLRAVHVRTLHYTVLECQKHCHKCHAVCKPCVNLLDEVKEMSLGTSESDSDWLNYFTFFDFSLFFSILSPINWKFHPFFNPFSPTFSLKSRARKNFSPFFQWKKLNFCQKNAIEGGYY